MFFVGSKTLLGISVVGFVAIFYAGFVPKPDPLCAAAFRADINGLKQMLEEGRSSNFRDKWGNTPLFWASKGGSVSAIRVLLNASAQVKATNLAGTTALHWACTRGSPDVVRALLDAGADVNHKNDNGETPLHWAVDWQAEAAVETLLERGADINAVDSVGNTAVQYVPKDCTKQTLCTRIVKRIMDKGLDLAGLNDADSSGLQAETKPTSTLGAAQR
ncbi:hypothetical protein AAMO2058_001371800 [Amorphochlora amoebiformis]